MDYVRTYGQFDHRYIPDAPRSIPVLLVLMKGAYSEVMKTIGIGVVTIAGR